MKSSIKLKVLGNIGKVYEEAKNCKLVASFFSKMDKELSFLSEYFRTTKTQSFFISLVFSLNYKGDTVDLNDLIEYFDCNPVKILEYHDDFEFLYLSGIFSKEKSEHRMKLPGANDQFTINEKISEVILQNKPMPEIGVAKVTDVLDLLEKLHDIASKRFHEEISTFKLFIEAKELILGHLHFPLINKINNLKLSLDNSYLYLYLIWGTILGRKTIYLGVALDMIYDNTTKRISRMQTFLAGENSLIKNNLVEIVKAKFINDAEMKLTSYSEDLLSECGIKLFTNKRKRENVISPKDIPHRELIFSKSEMEQLFLLKNLLNDMKFQEIQKRLSDKNLPIGITALLHGARGTGKTEIIRQIAKETNGKLI